MTSPFIPSSFTYGDSPQGGAVMPMVIAGRDPSDTTDKQYAAGYLWLSSLDQYVIVNGVRVYGSGNLFIQAGNVAGVPSWTILSAGAAGALNTLSDGSTVVLPSGGNIGIVGTANQVAATSSAPAHEIILSLPAAVITPGSLKSTSTMEVGTNLTVNGTSTLTGAVSLGNNLSISGTLSVTGASTLAALSATNGTFSGTLGVTGATTLAALSATNGTFSGTLAVTGTTTLAAVNATNAILSGTLGVSGLTTLAALTQAGVTHINITGSAATVIGTGGTGVVQIGNATGNTAVTGALSTTTTVTAGTGVTATTGNIVASAGNITSTVGSVSAATTVTAGTGITATTGNIVASTGNITSTLGSVNAGTSVTATNGNITATNGNIVRGTAGNKDVYTSVASNATAGANSAGSVALVTGTVTVNTTAVTVNSLIRLTCQALGTVTIPSAVCVSAKSAGASFTILASDATDTSTIFWEIVN